MRQQINLYQPVASQGRKAFCAATAGVTLAVVVVALAGLSVNAAIRVNRLERAVEQLRSLRSQQEAQLARSGDLQAARASPVDVQARVDRLAGIVADRTNALAVLQSGAAGRTSGFAARLEALARRHVDGLWIDSLIMSGTNGSMTLSGATTDAEIVPQYLHNLSREPVLAGTRFNELTIQRPDETAEDAAGDEAKPRSAVTAEHVRFRAGSKALLAPPREGAT